MNKPVNGKRAAELKRNRTWVQVGKVLAQEEGRPAAYGANPVARAAHRHRKMNP